MAKLQKSITINAPVEKVFGYLSDPNNLPEIWPSMVEIEPIAHTESAEGLGQVCILGLTASCHVRQGARQLLTATRIARPLSKAAEGGMALPNQAH